MPWIIVSLLIVVAASFIYSNFINTGNLKIESTPSGAAAKIVSTSQTYQTPIEISGLKGGDYQVEVSLQGYETQTRKVTVKGGETAVLKSTLLSKISSERSIGLAWVGESLRYAVSLANGTFELWSYQAGQTSKIYTSTVRSSKVIWSSKGDALVVDSLDNVHIFSGGTLRPLPIRGSGYSWNKGGTKIAYFSDRFLAPIHPQGLNTYDLASGQISNVFSDREISSRQTQWSPDGTKILYHEASLEEGGDIFIIDLSDSSKNKTVQTGQAYEVSWSPDSTKIAYLLGSALYALNLSETAAKPIYNSQDSESVVYAWSSSIGFIIAAGGQESGKIFTSSNSAEVAAGGFLSLPGISAAQGDNFAISTKSGLFVGKI